MQGRGGRAVPFEERPVTCEADPPAVYSSAWRYALYDHRLLQVVPDRDGGTEGRRDSGIDRHTAAFVKLVEFNGRCVQRVLDLDGPCKVGHLCSPAGADGHSEIVELEVPVYAGSKAV